MLKDALKSLLLCFDRKLVYVPRGKVWGSDLDEDLRIVVGKTSPVCFDVGANEGQTIDYLLRVFSSPSIHAFEPSPQTFKSLKKYENPPVVTTHNIGVGSTPGIFSFNEYQSSDLSSFLEMANNSESRFSGAKPRQVTNVEVTTVDNFMLQNSISAVDLLKSDTQGFDYQVLCGGLNALRAGAIKNILIEMNFIEIYEGQATVSDILTLLQDLNFGLVDLYDKERQFNHIQWCNALFTLKE